MSDSRLRKIALPRVTAWLYFFISPTVFGLGLLCVCLIVGSSGHAFDSYQKFEKSKKQNLPLQLEAMSDKEKVLPGETFWLHLVAFLDEDWHMYSIEKQSEDETVATRIDLKAPAFIPQGDWQEGTTILEPAGSGSTSKMVPSPASGTIRFYRVRFPVVWAWP